MNLSASFRYQISREKKGIFIYYCVWVGLVVLMTLLTSLFSLLRPEEHSVGSIVLMNGDTAATAIFAFVAGLCAFKENFAMSLQNGVSRKSLFFGRLCTAAACCLLMAAADECITEITRLVGRLPGIEAAAEPLIVGIYRGDPILMNPFARVALSIGYDFFLLLFDSGLGYFITTLYYRLNTPGKVAVSVGVPAFFIVGVPVLKMLRDHFHLERLYYAAAEAIVKLARFLFGTPLAAMMTYFAMFAVVSAFAWLLIRRAALKK